MDSQSTLTNHGCVPQEVAQEMTTSPSLTGIAAVSEVQDSALTNELLSRNLLDWQDEWQDSGRGDNCDSRHLYGRCVAGHAKYPATMAGYLAGYSGALESPHSWLANLVFGGPS